MASQRKRRRIDLESLQGLLHTGGISIAGLGKLLAKVRSLDLEELATNRRHLSDANLETFLKLRCLEHVPLSDGTAFDWEFLHPTLLVSELHRRNTAFRQLVQSALQRHPSSISRPWRIVVGFDEYVPGRIV